MLDLLNKATLPELLEAVQKSSDINALVQLVNVAQQLAQRAPLWDASWRVGHFSRSQLDEATEAAQDRIDELNKQRLYDLRKRDFLENLLPKREEKHVETRQSSFRRRSARHNDD